MSRTSISKVIVWQTFSKFLLQGIAFFTTPIFTRILSTSDYGKISIYGTWVSIFSLIVGLQTSGSIPMAMIKFEDKIDQYMSSIMGLSIISFLVIFPIVFIFRDRISNLIHLNSFLILLIVIQSFCSYSINFYSTKLIQQKRIVENTILSIIVPISSTILSIIFVFNFENKYYGKIIGSFIPITLSGVFLIFLIFTKGKTFLKKEFVKYCLPITLPLIFHGAGALVFNQCDRVMLQNMVDDSEVGIYAVVSNLASVISIIWMSFNSSWVPFYYEYRKKNEYDKILKQSTGYLFTFTILTIGFIFCAPEVFKFMAPPVYHKGISYIPFFALATYFNFLYSFPANFEFYSNNTKMIALGTILAAAVNIVLNYLLIPVLGGFGAALTTFVSYVVLFIFHELIARFFIKNGKYHYNVLFYIKGLLPISISVVLYYTSLNLWFIRWIFAVILGIILMVKFVRTKSIF